MLIYVCVCICIYKPDSGNEPAIGFTVTINQNTISSLSQGTTVVTGMGTRLQPVLFGNAGTARAGQRHCQTFWTAGWGSTG